MRIGRNGKSWDFLKAEDRKKARYEIMKEKPYIVIGSPPCTGYSNFNVNINYGKMDPE